MPDVGVIYHVVVMDKVRPLLAPVKEWGEVAFPKSVVLRLVLGEGSGGDGDVLGSVSFLVVVADLELSDCFSRGEV